MRVRFALLGILCLSMSLTGVAEENLFEFELDDLLGLEISVATAKQETLNDAPAVVSRYTISQLTGMGLRSIKDVLGFIPGFFTDKVNSDFPTLSVRGTATFSSANVLVMIDGVPAFSPTHHKPILLGVPFESIQHIEVIRGPGAVIYGTAAMSGVLNIVTKRMHGSSVSVQLGDGHKRRFSANYGKALTDTTDLHLFVDKQLDDGFAGTVISPSGPDNNLALRTQEDFSSALLRLVNSDWTLMAHYFSDAGNGHQNSIDLPLLQEQKSDGYLLHGDVKVALETGSATLYLDWQKNDQGFFGEAVSFIPQDQHDDRRLRIGGNWRIPLSEHSDVFWGAEYEERQTGGQNVVNPLTLATIRSSFEQNTIDEWAVFGQWDWQWQNWRVLLGARYIDHTAAGTSIKPRFSAVYSLSQKSSIKVLYSEGFTQPTFVQLFLDARPLVLGDNALVEEHLTSYDLAYTFTSEDTQFTANLFYYEGEDFIQVVPGEPGSPANSLWQNTPVFRRRGAEFDFRHASEQLTFMGNLTYLPDGNQLDPGDMRARLAPRYTANVGLSYRLHQHKVGFNLHLRSAREVGRVPFNKRWDVNYEYHWSLGSYLYVTARNLLSSEQLSPDVSTDFGFIFPRDHQNINWLVGVHYQL